MVKGAESEWPSKVTTNGWASIRLPHHHPANNKRKRGWFFSVPLWRSTAAYLLEYVQNSKIWRTYFVIGRWFVGGSED